MQPKTKFQKHVVGLQSKLKPVTEKQKAWGFEHCFKPHGFYTKHQSGCLECGHIWKQDGTKLLTILNETCECPACGKKLKMQGTRGRIYGDAVYYSVITTFKGFQVVRLLHLRKSMKLGTKVTLSSEEIMQFWVSGNGKSCVFSVSTNNMGGYGFRWSWGTNMELRGKLSGSSYQYNLVPFGIHPSRRLIPELKRNGFSGNFYDMAPQTLFERLLADSKVETLIKTDQTTLLRYYLSQSFNEMDKLWNSVKICIRHGYKITKPSIWVDYVNLLIQRGKDVTNPHYVCPANLTEAHDRLVKKSREIFRKQALEKQQRDLAEAQVEYEKAKSRFFGIAFQDEDLTVKVLETTHEFKEEADAHRHCVFSSRYYQKVDSLIMSARIGDKYLETVEISLTRMMILQSRGSGNQSTEHHARIISLVNNNLNTIRKIYETTDEKALLQSV